MISTLGLPSIQHRSGIRQPITEDGIQYLVLGPEMVIEIAARDLQSLGDVRKGCVLVTSLVKKLIGFLDDMIAGGLAAHEVTFSPARATEPVCLNARADYRRHGWSG
jgi:hypothetical protein